MPDAGNTRFFLPVIGRENDDSGCCYPCCSDSRGNSRGLSHLQQGLEQGLSGATPPRCSRA